MEMNDNWENVSNDRYVAYQCDMYGYRYILTATARGEYSVCKLLIKSPHIPARFARPMVIGHGTVANAEIAKQTAWKLFCDYVGIVDEVEASPVEEEPVSEPKTPVIEQTEETQTPTEEPTEEAVTEETEDTTVPSPVISVSVEGDEATVTISQEGDGLKVRYTINGKDVSATNRIYKEPFVVPVGTVVKAMAYTLDGNTCQNNQTEVEVR